MPVARLDLLHQFVDQQGLEPCGRHFCVKGDNIGSLRSGSDFAIILDISLLESGADVLHDLVVAFGVVLLADGVRHL